MDYLTARERLTGERSGRNRLAGLKIGVLYGGASAERDVSMESGEAVCKALLQSGRDVHRVILDDSFSIQMAGALEIDLAFLALHGEFGEDGRIQSILEAAGIPYTGSGVDASALCFDKILAKKAFERNGLLSPAWMSFERDEMDQAGGPENLGLQPPLVIKPASSGSSLGVSIVQSLDAVPSAIRKAFEFDDSVLIERFVTGREVSVSVLGDEPLPVCELRYAGEFYDFRAKYRDEMTRIVCPADLSREATNRVQAAALACHRGMGCRDCSRTDLILDARGLPWILEINTLPGLTGHSLLPRAADAAGIDFLTLVEFLLLSALEHDKKKEAAA